MILQLDFFCKRLTDLPASITENSNFYHSRIPVKNKSLGKNVHVLAGML